MKVRKFFKIILLLSMIFNLFGCTKHEASQDNSTDNEDSVIIWQKDLYYDFLIGNELKNCQFAVLDINNDNILDLIIKKRHSRYTKYFELYSIFDNKVIPIHIYPPNSSSFRPQYLQFCESDKNIESNVTYTNPDTNKQITLSLTTKMNNINDELYHINNQWLSTNDNDNFIFWSFSNNPLKYNGSKKDIGLSQDFDQQIISQVHYLPVIMEMEAIDVNTNKAILRPYSFYMKDRLLNGIDMESIEISSDQYSKIFYNYEKNVKGKNIDSIKKIDFCEANVTNYIKILK